MIDYYESIARAIDFMERHLTDEIDVADVSQHAFQSRWHFQRIFRNVTGYSVYTYLKKRRLAEAGSELLISADKIIDIALKYQYGTPESFLRAFRKEYNVNPSEYRKVSEHRVFARIDISDPKNRLTLDPAGIRFQPVTRNEILFIGKRNRTTMQNMQNEIDIPRFWQEFFAEGLLNQIPNRTGSAAMGIYCNWDYEENFDVLIGCQVHSLDEKPEHLVSHILAPAKYMVFTIPGNSNGDILNGWKYIYGMWMPSTGYEREFSDDFDLFDDRFSDPHKPESEIYIPIK